MSSASADALPTTPQQLTAVLREAGALHEGSVTAAEITLQHETSVSHLCFLTVTYARNSRPALADQLVLKWPCKNTPAPDHGAPELHFYRALAPALPSPPIPRCLATAAASSPQQWLLLEDLRSRYSNPPWPELPRAEALEGAASALAQVHAQWWEAETLGAGIGSLHTEAGLREMVRGIAAHLPDFVAALGDTLSPSDRLTLTTVFDSPLAPWLRLVRPQALTVVHGDAHPWNFLFPHSRHGLPYLIDWQLWHVDVGPRDLAFLLGLHCDPAVRKSLELRLLQLYHRQLAAEGIRDYQFDELLLDYRRCVVRNLTYPIIVWARGQPAPFWRQCLAYALAAYRDLRGADLLQA